MRKPIASAAALAASFLLVSCQTGVATVSLEEAKQITARFAGSFTPPPKSINDVLAKIPDGALEPRHCAYASPMTDEAFRKTMSSLAPPKEGRPGRVGFAELQADREFELGNFARSVKYMKEAVDAVPYNLRGFLVSRTAKLATLLAYAGEFEAADDAASVARTTMVGLQTSRWREDSVNLVNYLLDEARAAVAQSKGRLQEAEAYYRRALEYNAKMSFGRAVNWGGFTRVELAGNLTRQGRLLEAENALRDLLGSPLAYNTKSALVAKALGRLSAVLYEQGRYADAEALAGVTVRLYGAMCAAPESLSLAAVRDVLGKSLVAQGRWSDAIEIYEVARVAMAKDPGSFERLFAGNLYRALAFLHAGRTAEAAKGLEAALERSRDRLGDTHYKTAEIRGFLAMARAVDGDRAGALEAFAAATKSLLTRSRDSDDEDASFKARDRRLAVVLGAYIGLLADVRGTALEARAGLDASAEAFRLAEVARARAVERALSASGARAALADPELAELARREQDTKKQVAALYGTLATVLSRPGGREQARDVRSQIDTLRGARAALVEEIARRFPEYAETINPKPATVEEARAFLRPDEALIATYTNGH